MHGMHAKLELATKHDINWKSKPNHVIHLVGFILQTQKGRNIK